MCEVSVFRATSSKTGDQYTMICIEDTGEVLVRGPGLAGAAVWGARGGKPVAEWLRGIDAGYATANLLGLRRIWDSMGVADAVREWVEEEFGDDDPPLYVIDFLDGSGHTLDDLYEFDRQYPGDARYDFSRMREHPEVTHFREFVWPELQFALHSSSEGNEPS